MLLGLKARLLGMRVISDDGTTVLLRVPRWFSDQRMVDRLKEMAEEAELADKPISILRVGQVLRIERIGWTR